MKSVFALTAAGPLLFLCGCAFAPSGDSLRADPASPHAAVGTIVQPRSLKVADAPRQQDHSQHDHSQHDHSQHDHSQHDHSQHDHSQHHHGGGR